MRLLILLPLSDHLHIDVILLLLRDNLAVIHHFTEIATEAHAFSFLLLPSHGSFFMIRDQ